MHASSDGDRSIESAPITDGDLTPHSWERQVGESSPAWHAFQRYRDLGPRRTLDEVDRQLYPPPARAPEEAPSSARHRRRGHISSWSRRHDWVARAAAWDAEVDRAARVAQIDAVKAMNERHANAARTLQARAIEALQTLPASEMAAGDVLRFLVEACKLERLAIGEVTERTSQEISGGRPVVLEIVERIVPVRGADPVITPPVPDSLLPAVVSQTNSVADDEDGDPCAFELPDEPPACLRP
ncbi:MAG: hypothetical protein C0467_23230 [Planctomycetaceae bacterium]|nr:hypothetical protein [Planctomycetaceae bacterium]